MRKEQRIRIAFICIHNSCRSQMAEALAEAFFGGIFESYSAGTDISGGVNKDAVRIMKERYGIDMNGHTAKTISDIPVPDIAVRMGCGVECPYIGPVRIEDWGLADPSGKDDGEYVRTAGDILKKLQELSSELRR